MQGARTGLSGMQPCSMSESPCRSNSSGAASYLDGEPTESTRAMPSTNQHRAHPPGSSPARCSIPTAWRPHDDMRAPQHSCVLARSSSRLRQAGLHGICRHALHDALQACANIGDREHAVCKGRPSTLQTPSLMPFFLPPWQKQLAGLLIAFPGSVQAQMAQPGAILSDCARQCRC